MKKQSKGVPTNRDIRWDRLDNTAHLFPVIAGESMSNVYRISVTLKEEINPELLQRALDMVLPKFDGFNLRLRQGVFWYYFEENGKAAPKVRMENNFPCRYIQQNKNRSYMFRVTYYKCRINLEVFHVLTDGMGGINFLKELTYQYLRLAHKDLQEKLGDSLSVDTSLNREDSFLKNYKKSSAKGYQTKKAYLIRGEKLRPGEFGVMHGYMKIPELKRVCHAMGISINEYLVSVYIWSVYTECLHGMPSKCPIRVAVPVNLRPYFNSITTKNFFVMVSAEFHPTKETYTFAEVAAIAFSRGITSSCGCCDFVWHCGCSGCSDGITCVCRFPFDWFWMQHFIYRWSGCRTWTDRSRTFGIGTWNPCSTSGRVGVWRIPSMGSQGNHRFV